MFDEAKKSVESILSQRLSSPFYGTLIISWLIWNWKIIYLTIFISETKIKESKIDYIVSNYSDICHILYFPLISTLALLVFLPLITNGAFWLDLVYNKWRINKKNAVEGKQLLTVEESINLRELNINMEKRFESLLEDKNNEIKQLKNIIIETNQKSSSLNLNEIPNKEDDEIVKLVQRIKENNLLQNAFRIMDKFIIEGYSGMPKDEGITTDILSFYISNDLLVKKGGFYEWTEKGKQMAKILGNEKFNK